MPRQLVADDLGNGGAQRVGGGVPCAVAAKGQIGRKGMHRFHQRRGSAVGAGFIQQIDMPAGLRHSHDFRRLPAVAVQTVRVFPVGLPAVRRAAHGQHIQSAAFFFQPCKGKAVVHILIKGTILIAGHKIAV